MPRPLSLVVPLIAAVLLIAAAPASALRTKPCPHAGHFRCGTLRVPLDRSGRIPGTVGLAVAVERPRAGTHGFVVALSGGPGQPSLPFAESFRDTLRPALRHRRLVLVDQRGTGRSGALRCRGVQRLGTLDVVETRLVRACARHLGPARQAYATTDSVQDLDALRAALGARRLELMGVSYGTYVAVQYARRYPRRTAGLILDSVVGPDGIDTYFMDTFARLPRILREQCLRGRCRGATRDPLADLARLTARLQRGPLRGTVVDEHGRRQASAIHDESELVLMIMSGDLNPWMQNAFPAAIAAAVHGDPTPLLRLRRPSQGPPTSVKDFSVGLNVTTTCADVRLPYALDAPLPERVPAWLHGTDATPASAFAPFSRHAVIDTSTAHDCLRWPRGDRFTPPSLAPLPDVRALVLSGRWDTRTPTENARELLPSLPHGQLLTVGGTGHDVLDSDITGCAAKALRRFAAERRIGTPCRGRSNAVPMLARPARSLRGYRPAPGVRGVAGRVIGATLDTIADAQNTALQTLFAGFPEVHAGGLRGGWVSAPPTVARMRLHRYALVPGVAVSGTVRAGRHGGGFGTLTVDAPGRLDGVLRLRTDGSIGGTLGGRAVHAAPASGGGADAASRASDRVPAPLLAAGDVAAAVRAAHRLRSAGS
ncbi:MAG TPA: alpha/beta hydrolase [Baekduia sp.]|nr:alpha/beta hydrolase [Baekduia sp.]